MYDVYLQVINLVQTCFLAYLAFRARPHGPLERPHPGESDRQHPNE